MEGGAAEDGEIKMKMMMKIKIKIKIKIKKGYGLKAGGMR